MDFATSLQIGPYRHSNVAAAVARCAAAADRSAICLEDFAPYAPSGGAPIAFMAAPVIDQGVVIGVLIAQLSIEEIDNVVTGDRHWRQEGFGATGEAYLVGPDYLVRSGPRAFYENREHYFAELKAGGASDEEIDAIRRYGTPVLHQRIDTQATRAALAGVEGTGEIVGYRGIPTLASWGPLAIPGVKWALVAKIDTAEAFAPIYQLRQDLMIVGGLALLVVAADRRLAVARAARAAARAHRRREALRRRRLRRQGAGPHARRDRPALLGLQRHGRRAARQEHRHREQEPRERGAAAERPAGADRQPAARRRAEDRRRLRRGHGRLRRPGRLHRAVVGDAAARRRDLAERPVHPLRRGRAASSASRRSRRWATPTWRCAACPMPVANHAERMVRMAIRMVHITREHAMEHHVSMKLRVGINSGPVVAGVIGKSKYIYDLWGDTVNLASRMESGGMPDSVQVTRPVYEKLKDQFVFEPRGAIEVKGKGASKPGY